MQARVKESINPLMEVTKQEIAHKPENDQHYRLVISNELVAKWVFHMATRFNYKSLN